MDRDAVITAALALSRNLPLRQPFIIRFRYNDFLQSNNMQHNATAAVIYGLCVSATSDFHKPSPAAEGAINNWCIGISTNNVIANIPFNQPYPPGATDLEYTFDVFNTVKECIAKATKWLVELVAAEQSGSLRERNYESYFKMSQGEVAVGKIILVVKWVAATTPKLMENEDLQEEAANVPWLKYHTAAASTPQLVQKFMNETGELHTFSDDVRNTVREAVENFWLLEPTYRIPQNIVAHTYVYLESTNQLPDNWYQGIRAINNMAGYMRTRYRTIYKRYVNFKAGVADIEAADALAALRVIGRVDFIV